MLFDLASDLHFDFYVGKDFKHKPKGIATVDCAKLRNPGSDVLVIAGDSNNHYKRLLNFLKRAEKIYKYVVFVDGNHEHYTKHEVFYTERRLREFTFRHPTVIYLDGRNKLIVGRTAFVGVNGWYDWKAMEPDFSSEVQKLVWQGRRPPWRERAGWLRANDDPEWDERKHGSNDRYIRLGPHVTIPDLAAQQARRLARQVEQLSQDPDIEEIVVTTHTAPARHCLINKPHDLEWQAFGGSYVNTEMANVLAIPNHKIKVWNYGHIHDRKMQRRNGIAFCINARGYPDQQAQLGRDWGFAQLDSAGY